jgi:glycosyltransferase involved in cell wall biosynthesis
MIRVVHLGSASGPPAVVADRLAGLGVDSAAVRSVVRSAYDVARFRSVRRAVADYRPHVLHAWDPPAARTAWLLTRPRIGLQPAPRLVLSGTDRPEPGWRGLLTSRAIAAADRVIAFGPAELSRYRAAGVPESRLVAAPLGVQPVAPAADVRPSLGIPAGTPYVVAVGGFDAAAGMIDAVWAFDVVRYADPAVRLVLVGDGPERARVERFARSIFTTDYRVVFAGDRSDVPAVLAGAVAVWVPAARGGTAFALDALAAGVPVVGFRTPDLEAVIDDGTTGFLVPPSDRPALSGRTLELLDDSSPRDRIVTAGRAAATGRFPPGPVAEAVASAYHTLAPPTP